MRKLLKSHREVSLVFSKIKILAVAKRAGLPFDDKFYSTLQKEYGNETVGQIIKKDNTCGKCYFYAMLLTYGMPDSTFTTGVLHRLDLNQDDRFYEEFGHGWVERGDLVYDTTAKQIFTKEFYYKYYDVQVLNRIPAKEICEDKMFIRLGMKAVQDRPELANRLLQFDGFKSTDRSYVYNCLFSLKNKTTALLLTHTYEDVMTKKTEKDNLDLGRIKTK